MKRILTALLGLMLCMTIPASMSAQSGYQVKGTVVDAMGPVIGAAVMERGTTTGTMTDLDGNFVLTVSGPGAIIEVSCMSYATQTFTASQMPATITLLEDTEFLEDVVVIGYGTVKKEDLTGSVATVKADEINKGAITSPADLIRGKSAGVVVTAGDGMPGSAPTIRVRGGSSLSATNNPLIIVDGLPVSNDGVSGTGDPLSSINPNDIESFTVLKDASATAIYGSRASNGVIVITTKKGNKGSSAPHFDVNYQHSLSMVSKYVDVLDAEQVKQAITDHISDPAPGLAAMGTANTDWQKEIYQFANGDEVNASVRGNFGLGNAGVMPYRVSLGYNGQQGILKTSDMKRATASVNLSPTLLDRHLTVNLNGKYNHQYNFFANQSAIGAAIHMDPSHPVYNSDGSYFEWMNADGTFNTMATMNPVALLNQKKDSANADRFIGNAQFDYKIHGFEDLRLNLNLGIDFAKSKGITEAEKGSAQSAHNTQQSGSGYHTDYDYTRNDQTLEFYADYTHTFAEKHNVDLMAGYSWQHFSNNSHSNTVKLTDGSVLANNPFATEYFLVSFFGRANYNFADKYLLTATIRRDGTSRFQNNKWGLFPSVALGWNIKKEGFLKDNDAVSTAKLRLSWGKTGQQDLQKGDYPTIGTYFTNLLGSYYYFGSQLVNPISPMGYNAALKWETTTTYNAGIDLGFAGDRVRASVDVYNRPTSDLINYIPVAAGSALTNYLTTNIGDLVNKGVEVELNFIPVETKDMSLQIGINGAYNHNEITRLNAAKDDVSGVETGGIAGGTGNNVQMHMVGQPANAFYVYQQIYGLDGKPVDGAYVDRNGDGQITADDKYFYHKPSPDFTGGLNIQFSWKNLTAALSGHGMLGNWNYYNVASDAEMWNDLWINSFISNRLTSALNSNFQNARYLSDYYVRDASFFKLDNFTLGYTFPELLRFGERALGLNIYGTVQNIYTFTNYDGIDPEVYGGIDGTIYPRPRTFILGLKLNF